MSLIVTVWCPEGIVMASDSRLTYTTTETQRDNEGNRIERSQLGTHFTDTVYKTFRFRNGRIGVSTCGNGKVGDKRVTQFVEEVFNTFDEEKEVTVEEMSKKLNEALRVAHASVAAHASGSTSFIVAGYDSKEDWVPKVWNVSQNSISGGEKKEFGATWDGQRNILSRLFATLHIKQSIGGGEQYIPHTEWPVLWDFFTLQDAVDFAEYAIRTTIETMRFQRCVKSVGGPIDILVLKPSGGQWIARKELFARGGGKAHKPYGDII